ncbi:MAG: hypothetical protein AAF376_09000 [Pseudomonadota bacterium]
MLAPSDVLTLVVSGTLIGGLAYTFSGAVADSDDGVDTDVDGQDDAPDLTEDEDAAISSLGDLLHQGGESEALQADGAGDPAPAAILEIYDTTDDGSGAEIACVEDFESGVDRLILDFEGGAEDAPDIGFDIDSDPGNTVVLANGVPVTVLLGTTSVDISDIDIHMSDDAETEATEGAAPEYLMDDESDPWAAYTDHDELHFGAPDDVTTGDAGSDALFGYGAADTILDEGNDDDLEGLFEADTLADDYGDEQPDGAFAGGGAAFGPFDGDGSDPQSGLDGDDRVMMGAEDAAVGEEADDSVITGSFIETAEVAGVVEDFDPDQDVIEVMYDPEEDPDPQITVQTHPEGGGVQVLMDGEIILNVMGGQNITADQIELREIEFDPVPETA